MEGGISLTMAMHQLALTLAYDPMVSERTRLASQDLLDVLKLMDDHEYEIAVYIGGKPCRLNRPQNHKKET